MQFVKRWLIPLRMVLPIPLLLIACATGCGTRTVYIKPGDPVRLRKTISGAEVWAQDKDGKWVAGSVDLSEGWYVLPDPGEEPKK